MAIGQMIDGRGRQIGHPPAMKTRTGPLRSRGIGLHNLLNRIMPEVEVKDVDALVVVGDIWDGLGLTEALNAVLGEHKDQGLTTGLALKALVLNIVGGRDALYRVQRWAERVPLDLVVGEGVRAEQLNDSSLARHLDRLFEVGAETVFNTACLRVVDQEGISLDRLHGDTTSRLVFGEYRNDEEGTISITRGHSKDERPDLKQVMYGLTTSSDGIPVAGQMLSGNTSDKAWHGGMLPVVHQLVSPRLDKPTHYVGDSALITGDNLDVAKAHNIVLTSRLPRTYALCDTIVMRALHDDTLTMEAIGTFAESALGTSYEGVVVPDCELSGHRVQLGVFRPTPANPRTTDSVHRRQQRFQEAAKRVAKRLMGSPYACDADARTALASFMKDCDGQMLRITGDVVKEEVPAPRPRGRPKAGAEVPLVTQYRLAIEVDLDNEAREAAIAEQSCFVLVHTGEAPMTAREMMAAYKGQSVVETRFPFLKDPSWADVFFVKTPHRVEALGYVLMLALLLWSVWERRVRLNLEASGEGPVVDTTKMKKPRPTAMVCSHILRGIKVMRTRTAEGCTNWSLVGALDGEQARVIRLSHPVEASSEAS
jgi:transposase